jgi:hypothetical protein
MMKQLARLQFSSNQIKVPEGWSQPSGDPAGKHYSDAFKPEEKNTVPVTAVPPLVLPQSMNKYHTDTQKMVHGKIGTFMDGICDAICGAWSTWQSAATLTGVIVNAVTAAGGQVVGPPLTPLILAQGPKASPMEMKYTQVVATVIGTSWLSYTTGIKVKGMPWYPAFAAVPSPVAPPMPNVPCPVIAISSAASAVGKSAMKGQMISQLGDPKAPFHKELFDAICDAFEKCHKIWEVSTMVTNVLGTGPVPTFAPPYVPVGPVVGGVGNMVPGGFV